ncbi:SdpI family protein [Sphingomonas sp. Leaf21]|uniref:SdpI family protein n=1 Tax=Sphingomonas sp. Leaf21 TaxID=2876550 RepID=UPI001E2D2303|nr:SdpI family protein [Sphingomonas sp. Leaf21]
MSFRPLILASALVAGGMALVSALALSRLPPGTMLPTHWNAAGQADHYAGAAHALFMPVILTIVTSAMMATLPRIEPLQSNLEGSAPLLRAAWAGILALFVGIEAMVAGPAFGWTPPGSMLLVGLGFFLIAIGNTLPKSRPGFFVGIRTPWTITDTDNWIATHRFGGWLFAGTGLAIVVVAILPMDTGARGGIVTTALLSAALTPVVFSYFRWRATRPR